MLNYITAIFLLSPLLLCGYSLFSALSLIWTQIRHQTSWPAGLVLMLALCGIQISHALILTHSAMLPGNWFYSLCMFTVAPAFYLFSKPFLRAHPCNTPKNLLHFLPTLLAFVLPMNTAIPAAFFIGAGYTLWLGHSIYALRAQRERFQQELITLVILLGLALIMLILALFISLLDAKLFYMLYASVIGSAFILVNLALANSPQIPERVIEAAHETYAVSTLSNVDCDAVLQQLESLMQQQKLYQDSELDLAAMAQQVNLSTHQLSELINTRLGIHFSRYIREYRIKAAQTMLIEQPSVAVLAIGMSVGFASQSNFYEAFREITGTTPGKYRKLAQTPAQS